MELNEIALNHFHSLELREIYQNQSILWGKQATEDMLIDYLAGDSFQAEFSIFFKRIPDRQDYLDLKIAYYLLAGCGINRIQRALNVAQSRVYRVKDEVLPTLNNLEPCYLHHFIVIHPHMIDRIQNIMALINVLDGFRILAPSNRNIYMNGQVRN